MRKNNFYKMQMEGLSEVAETVRVIEKSSASHLHFLKKKMKILSCYKQQIQAVLGRLSNFYWDNNHPLLGARTLGKSVLLVISGAKGIVGGLYHELINEVIIKSKDYNYIWIIGNKGKEYLYEEGIQAKHIFTLLNFADLPSAVEIHKMTDHLLRQFQEANLKNVDVLYANFISLAKQVPIVTKFLPFNFIPEKSFDFSLAAVKAELDRSVVSYLPVESSTTQTGARIDKQNKLTDGFPIFEPSKKFIFGKLLEKYIDVFFAKIILEAKLSEFAARTATAESAVKETERLIHTFNREFLKAKHLTITQKQIESFSVHQLTRV